MRRHAIVPLGVLLGALAVAACGAGGGGDGTDATGGTDGTDPNPVTTTGTADLVVLRYDVDGDGLADVVTLDTGESPYAVVEALLGTETGGTVDGTAAVAGRPVDPAIAAALAEHLASAAEVGSETELLVQVESGETVPVTVFE
jgi:hypothetical protein